VDGPALKRGRPKWEGEGEDCPEGALSSTYQLRTASRICTNTVHAVTNDQQMAKTLTTSQQSVTSAEKTVEPMLCRVHLFEVTSARCLHDCAGGRDHVFALGDVGVQSAHHLPQAAPEL